MSRSAAKSNELKAETSACLAPAGTTAGETKLKPSLKIFADPEIPLSDEISLTLQIVQDERSSQCPN
jgi:hypothetical protein